MWQCWIVWPCFSWITCESSFSCIKHFHMIFDLYMDVSSTIHQLLQYLIILISLLDDVGCVWKKLNYRSNLQTGSSWLISYPLDNLIFFVMIFQMNFLSFFKPPIFEMTFTHDFWSSMFWKYFDTYKERGMKDYTPSKMTQIPLIVNAHECDRRL